MNPTENIPQSNQRLQRIKIVSRLARVLCYVFLAYSVGFFIFWVNPGFAFGGFHAGMPVVVIWVSGIILWIWYWTLARLFHFYEQGKIFDADPIRCIKLLGLLVVIGWALGIAFPRHSVPAPEPPPSWYQSSKSVNGTTTTITLPATVQTHTYRMGFFSCDFGTGIDFGPLLGGALILVIAWIMEEGRKLQEEQELTV